MAKNKELPTFEQALSKLEGIVKNLGDQGVPLAEALEQFEEGIGHYRRCAKLLEEARLRVEQLSKDAAGNFDLLEIPFEHTDEPVGE